MEGGKESSLSTQIDSSSSSSSSSNDGYVRRGSHNIESSMNNNLLPPSVFDADGTKLDMDKLMKILKQNPDKERDTNSMSGKTLLHYVCENNFASIVVHLLKKQVSTDIQDVWGKTPLHYCENEKIVRLLCSHGANVSVLDENKETPMHVYIKKRLLDCVQVILEYDFDPSIAKTMDMSSFEMSTHTTCLHLAAEVQDFEILNILVTESKNLSDINIRDSMGNSVLHLISSAIDGTLIHQKAIMILLDKGIEPDMKNNQGVTPLHLLCANRSFIEGEMIEPMIELLLHLNCDPNGMDETGCTPLIIACAHREWSVCKILLQHGADMNLPCALHSALLLRSQRSQSNSIDGGDPSSSKGTPTKETFIPFTEISDCTASDLFPRKARQEMFEAISVSQSWVPDNNRDRCMNCADLFAVKFSIYNLVSRNSSKKSSSTRHHCRHCGRLICDNCLANEEIDREKLPLFVRLQFKNEKKMKVCKVCCEIFSREPESPAVVV